MAVLGVIAFAAVMVFILFVRFRRKKRHRRYPTQNRKVLVRKGMNISKIVAGEEKGDHFSGNLKQQKTFFADPAVKICRIRLENSKTGRQSAREFWHRMWIGRGGGDVDPEGMLIISADPKISRIHCMLSVIGDSLYLEDLHSSNHTYLNGRQINKKTSLQNGDEIHIGDTRLRIWYEIEYSCTA